MWTYLTCIPESPGAPGRDGTKGDRVAQGKPGPKDHVVLMERKEQRESLGSRVPPDKKDSEGTKATVERDDWLHT